MKGTFRWLGTFKKSTPNCPHGSERGMTAWNCLETHRNVPVTTRSAWIRNRLFLSLDLGKTSPASQRSFRSRDELPIQSSLIYCLFPSFRRWSVILAPGSWGRRGAGAGFRPGRSIVLLSLSTADTHFRSPAPTCASRTPRAQPRRRCVTVRCEIKTGRPFGCVLVRDGGLGLIYLPTPRLLVEAVSPVRTPVARGRAEDRARTVWSSVCTGRLVRLRGSPFFRTRDFF